MKITYFAVDDASYPRNRLIRERLKADGHTVHVAAIPKSRSYAVRSLLLVLATLRRARKQPGTDLIVLSEFAAQYAFPAWLAARLIGARLIHDYFVGLVETNIEDWQAIASTSLRGRIHRFLDALAVRLPDLVLCDTNPRATAVRMRTTSKVLVLPVESPSWARDLGTPAPATRAKVLFYGNYIPLHGVPTIVEAALGLPIDLTIIGSGAGRSDLELLARGSAISFEDAVPETVLVEKIRESHVILGIFGVSRKAATVIPNKVWQGLTCGRVVVTRESEAYKSLPLELTKNQLVQVAPGDARALHNALRVVVESQVYSRSFPDSERLIRALVDGAWEHVRDWIDDDSRWH